MRKNRTKESETRAMALDYIVRHKEFNADDFLNTILKSYGIKDIPAFLKPTKAHTHSPFLLANMEKAITLIKGALGKKIFIKADCDVDGVTSFSVIYQFIKDLDPNTEIVFSIDVNKRHGLFTSDVKDIEDLALIIVPDASATMVDLNYIDQFLGVPVLIIDHHIIENEQIMHLSTVVNCRQNNYPSPNLSGVGVVYKVMEAYKSTYNADINIEKYLDLVACGMIADSVDLSDLEVRYYVLKGLQNVNNSFLLALGEKLKDEMKTGWTIDNIGWVIAPKINACIRFGNDNDSYRLCEALINKDELVAYQPRRRRKTDPQPPLEFHTLQQTMARLCGNAKSRQDDATKSYVKTLIDLIKDSGADQHKIIIIDIGDIIKENTLTGLVANKIANEFKRPTLLLRSKNKNQFGGSGRSFGRGVLTDLRNFLLSSPIDLEANGHPNAFGHIINKTDIDDLLNYADANINDEDLTLCHEVDFKVTAEQLKLDHVISIAEHSELWGRPVNKPTFIIENLTIPAKEIQAIQVKGTIIQFTYNGITFKKKYCPKGEYEEMTLKPTRGIGYNFKTLKLNLICSFENDYFDGKTFSYVKIMHYDVEDITPNHLEKEKPATTNNTPINTNTQRIIDVSTLDLNNLF